MSDECIGRRRVLMRRAHALSTAQHSAFAVMCLSLHSQSHSHSVLGPPRSLSHERGGNVCAANKGARATRAAAESSRTEPSRSCSHTRFAPSWRRAAVGLESSRVESFRSFSRLLLWPPFLFVRCVVRVESSGSIHTCICCSSALSLLFTCIHRHMHMHRVPQIYSTLRSRTRARARTTYTLRGIGKPLDFTDSLDRQRAAIAMPCHATLLQCTACVAKHNNFNGRK